MSEETTPAITAKIWPAKESEPVNAIAVNPGDWFGIAFILSLPVGNFSQSYIVEAETEQDAIDEFSESKYGHAIHIADEDLPEDEDALTYDGNGQAIDLSELKIERVKEDDFPIAKYFAQDLPECGLTPKQYDSWSDLSPIIPGRSIEDNAKVLKHLLCSKWRGDFSPKTIDILSDFYEAIIESENEREK